MRYRLKCPTNRYVFKSHLNCSESTAGSLRQSGSEFQTVGPATEKARVPKVPRRTRRYATMVFHHFMWLWCWCYSQIFGLSWPLGHSKHQKQTLSGAQPHLKIGVSILPLSFPPCSPLPPSFPPFIPLPPLLSLSWGPPLKGLSPGPGPATKQFWCIMRWKIGLCSGKS